MYFGLFDIYLMLDVLICIECGVVGVVCCEVVGELCIWILDEVVLIVFVV